MELKVLKCPNCGANTTNAQNCEYCGSLLVRFVDKGINLAKTSYTNNDQVIPGLVEELNRNLQLQRENPNEWVATDIHFYISADDTKDYISILPTNHPSYWLDNTDMQLNNGIEGFLICLDFREWTGNVKAYYNQKVNNRLRRFKELDSFPLFTCHMSSNEEQYGPEYAINFGADAEGAARLISEIWYKVFRRSVNNNVDFLTNVGVDNVNRARLQWDNAHYGTNQKDNSGCLGLIGGAIIVGATSLLISCL